MTGTLGDEIFIITFKTLYANYHEVFARRSTDFIYREIRRVILELARNEPVYLLEHDLQAIGSKLADSLAQAVREE